MTKISENLKSIHERINAAQARSERSAASVTLVAVTKTVSVERISEAQQCGESVFGENRVQELNAKYPEIKNAHWHLIGHLQTNKVKYAVGKAELIHSVDSLHLAEAINAAAEKLGIVQNFLLEVNISGEESKYGLTIDEIADIMKETEKLKNIRFRGFMTMAPKAASESEIRAVFRRAHDLFVQYNADILSMGMSGDFELAVEEGATHVRVGSAIFKE